FRHCERSEAIHSSACGAMDCFVASLLAMTRVCARIPAARNVRALPIVTLEKQRVQGMPGARRTHCLACKQKRRTQANTGTPKSLRHSLRNGLRLTSRSRRSTGLVSLRPPGLLSLRVDPSIGGSGPHAFAVRLDAHHLTRLRVHRNPPPVW